jgi:hypothetical protein
MQKLATNMLDGILKYELLNTSEKKEVNDFIEFLFSKKKREVASMSNYKKKILSVGVWSDEDVKIFEENNTKMNQWKPESW